MAAGLVVLTEDSMALAEKYLFDGEHIVALFKAEGFLQRGELVATEGRVICAGPGRFRDVKYDCLSSVGCGSVYEPAWACASFVFTALAIAFARAAAFVPESLSFGPFGISLGWLASLVGFPGVLCGALAVVAAVIFLITTRMCIFLQSPGGRLAFDYGRGRHDEAVAFTKAIRAACHRKA
jgi:hypothetical protein